MTTRTPPQHGERRCYLRGCQRPECVAAHKRYMKHYRLTRARHGTRRIDANPTAQYVRELAEEGWSHRQIAAAANCSTREITALARGEYPTIAADIAKRILNARPAIHIAPPRTYVDATGSIRRVQALMAIGRSLQSIAQNVDMSATALGRVINHQHDRITARCAKNITTLYEQWAGEPGTNERARRRAARLGWKTPDYWQDMGRIDDHDFDPDVKSGSRAQQIAEEAHWLLAAGEDRDRIAHRLGISRFYLDRSLRENPTRQENAA